MFKTIRSQLMALAIFTVLAVLAVGGMGLYIQGQLDDSLTEAEGGGVAMRNHMQSDMLHDNLRGLVEQHNGAARDNDAARIQAAVKDLTINAQGIREEFAKNKAVAALPDDIRADIARVEPIVDKYAQAALAVAGGTTTDPAALEKARADFSVQFKVLEKELGGIRDKIEATVTDAKTRGDALANRTTMLTAFVLFMATLAILFFALRIYAGISHSLGKISATITEVQSGTLSARTELTGTDELSEVGRSFDNMLEERVASLQKSAVENETLNNSVIALLQTVFQLSNKDLTARAVVTEDVIGTLSSSINQFSDETSQTLGEVQNVADQVRQISESVRRQAEQVEVTAQKEQQSLHFMSQNLTLATDQLTQVAALSDQSSQTAERASVATQAALTAVDGTVRGMDTLRESISEMEKRFKRLGERSQEISTAVQLVNTISERTHVLALNASMQAATAGEAGRGFAVVAEEVQRLSDSSRQATATISGLVGNIQAETNETLFTVNRLIGEVVSQSDLAQRAGVQMTQTQATTAQLVGLVQQIAQFSKQQAALAATLQQSVLDINEGAAQTSQAITQQTASTETLVDFARKLTESVGQFKLPPQAA
jgi:methyl-accepting chemotaxis protein